MTAFTYICLCYNSVDHLYTYQTEEKNVQDLDSEVQYYALASSSSSV